MFFSHDFRFKCSAMGHPYWAGAGHVKPSMVRLVSAWQLRTMRVAVPALVFLEFKWHSFLK